MKELSTTSSVVMSGKKNKNTQLGVLFSADKLF